MAIDYTTLTAIEDTLKFVYGEGLTNQFADEKTTYNQFPKTGRSPKGLGYEFGIRYARAQGVGARRESANLPDPLTGKTDKGRIMPKYIYGSIRLTGPSIEAAKGDIAAFVDSLSDAIDDIYKSIVVDLNRMSCSDGFGLLGTLSQASDALSASVAWTVTMDNDLSVSRCIPGMIVDFYTGGTAIDQSAVASRILSVHPNTKTIEMEGNDGTYKANHPIVAAQGYTIATDAVADAAEMVKIGAREAAHATTDVATEMMGLEGIYDDGTLLATFENITVADYPEWKANILGNSGTNREVTINLMLQALDLARVRGGDGIQTIRMGLGQRRKYANLLIPDIRFTPGTLEGGYETLTFSGGDGSVKMTIDPALPPNKMFFEPNGAIEKFEMTPLGWGNIDPGMHQRAGYDEYDRFLRIYTNIGTEKRASLVLLKDLVEPSLYT